MNIGGYFKVAYSHENNEVSFLFKDFKYDGATVIKDWFPLITKAAAVHDAILHDKFKDKAKLIYRNC